MLYSASVYWYEYNYHLLLNVYIYNWLKACASKINNSAVLGNSSPPCPFVSPSLNTPGAGYDARPDDAVVSIGTAPLVIQVAPPPPPAPTPPPPPPPVPPSDH